MADHVGQSPAGARQFGQYRLNRFLGQGSFGEVYLGEHISNHTLAAVKLLQARLTAEDLKEFINEASTMFRLQHPHIVQLLDFGIGPENTPFLVMAYASGGTLRQRYPKGTRLPLQSIIAYVGPLASALQYAHDQRLIHRDVKPENILLGPNNEVWLSDFGITSVAHSTHSLDIEKPGGTVPYMAPEQLRGKARPASDQYALGVIVYEWLCGERPFSGTATEIAMQHFVAPPPSLREKIPTISPDVEQVVMTALAKDPAARWASVQAFALALQAAAGAQPRQNDGSVESRVSVGGVPASSMSAPMDEARLPIQPNEQIAPTLSPTGPFAEPVAPVLIPPLPVATDGKAATSVPLEVAQGAKPLPAVPITPGLLPVRRRLSTGRIVALILLTLVVVGGGGIWATLYVTTHQPDSQSSANIFQMTAIVGHNDSANNPSIFFAFDLQGQATVLELPGGDGMHSKFYVGPSLSDSHGSVTLRFQNVMGGSLPDMIVYAGQDIEVFENNGSNSFSPVPPGSVQQSKLPETASSNVNYPLSWAEAVVGHSDSAAHPSDFLALNIRDQVIVYEFRGGSSSSVIAYFLPPVLFSGNDQTVPALSFSDRNHDGKIDMILNVAGLQHVYYNNGSQFVESLQ